MATGIGQGGMLSRPTGFAACSRRRIGRLLNETPTSIDASSREATGSSVTVYRPTALNGTGTMLAQPKPAGADAVMPCGALAAHAASQATNPDPSPVTGGSCVQGYRRAG